MSSDVRYQLDLKNIRGKNCRNWSGGVPYEREGDSVSYF